MVGALYFIVLLEQSMSRLVFALLSLTLFVGLACEFVSEARAAAAFCDVSACTSKRCKNARSKGIQRCTTNCLIDIEESKKKGLCK
jgi:hypothetical protein